MASICILFGSQTGCASQISERIADRLTSAGQPVNLLCANRWKEADLVGGNGKLLLLIVSTTGNGDAPDNATTGCDRFWRFIKRRSQPKTLFEGLRYAVLGLGDTNYDKFCYMGKAMHKRLGELGAQCVYELGCADDAVGLDQVVEPWVDGVVAVAQSSRESCATRDALEPAGAISLNAETKEADGLGAGGCAESTSADDLVTDALEVPTVLSFEQVMGTEVSDISGKHFDDTKAGKGLPRLRNQAEGVRVTLTTVVEAPDTDANRSTPPASPSRSTVLSKSMSDTCSENKVYDATVVGMRYLTVSARVSSEGGSTADEDALTQSSEQGLGQQESQESGHDGRRVILLDIEVSQGAAIDWFPGDAIGVYPRNDASIVHAILALLGHSKSEHHLLCVTGGEGANGVVFPNSCTLFDAFSCHLDITTIPRKAFLRMLSTHCKNESDRIQLAYLSGRSGRDAYQSVVEKQQLNLLEILQLFPSCQPPLDALLLNLPPLMPRFYSVASSPLESPRRISVAFSAVEYDLSIVPFGVEGKVHKIPRRGVCTTWLEGLGLAVVSSARGARGARGAAAAAAASPAPGKTLSFTLRKSNDFSLPPDPTFPVVMIGPGTGVAPFIGFVRHRDCQAKEAEEARSAVCEGLWRGGCEVDCLEEDGEVSVEDSFGGPMHLFFGCRHEKHDYLFRDTLEKAARDGTLDSLHVAFSRDQIEKVYVTHRLREQSTTILDVIEQGGYIFVCGDGAAMAKSVHEALVDIIAASPAGGGGGGGTTGRKGAEEQLTEMAARSRYVKDVW